MKTVQDKDGKIIEVIDDTPCHAGKNGAFPIMLDAVKDANVFAEMAAKEVAYDAKAPEREEAAVIAARKAEYGTAEEQLERIIEGGLEAEQARIASIKLNHPKRS